jgi:phage recombination protein Bet
MTTAIAKADFSREQIDTIKQTVARGANDAQLALFLEVCRSRGLDPFTKQVYYTPQGVIVSIDGLRSIAERTGCYAPGPTRFELDANGGLVAAHVTVRKLVAGQWFDVEASAYYEEYKGTSPIWRRMPKVMLEKCGESRALRKCFPAHLSGLYESSEMDQAQRDERPVEQPRTVTVTVEPVEQSAAYLAAANAINEANTQDDLKVIAGRIAGSRDILTADEQRKLREIYVARKSEIGGAQ